jgi:hypothetical protein
MAGGPVMDERSISHKGHSIVIRDDPDKAAVTIDGHPVRVFRSDAGYWTPHQAYQRFASLDDLARAVAEITQLPDR